MRAVTRFLLKQLIIFLTLAVVLLFANLSLQAAEMAEQDSPQDCVQLYLQYPPYERCTNQWGTCTVEA
jgi:hypothetical protein